MNTLMKTGKNTMEYNHLEGKVIVVSGGTKGVGRFFAEVASSEGAKIVVAGRDEKAGHEVIGYISQSGGDSIFVPTDLLKISQCERLFRMAYEKYGRIDGFFNYAGVTPVSALDTCDEQTFDWIMDVNFKAAFFCCQQTIKYMRLSGGGSIVLTGSAHAWGGQKDRAAYACSKGALRILSEHIAHQYAREQIRCNYLTLGWTPTDGEIALRKSQGETEEELRERASYILPMGRMCEASDYMEALIYLFSDASTMMTGSIFRITAGEYI